MFFTTSTPTTTLSDLAGQKVRLQFEHPFFVALSFNCTVEGSVMDTVKLWIYDMDRTDDNAMMVIHGDTKVEEAEHKGVVYYRVRFN